MSWAQVRKAFLSFRPADIFWSYAFQDYLLLGAIYGFFGGYQCFNLGLYGAVSDVSSVADRTTRLSILNGVFSLGYVVGTQIGSAMYTNVGNFYAIFGLSCVFGVAGILYTVFVVKESVTREEDSGQDYNPWDLSNLAASFR